MRFSIVTISFNQAAFLERAICSVLDQDYPDLEYIVVDPGSADGSRDIIERYRSRISRIVYQPDGGAAEGLNNGFSQATGEMFGFLNADDMLLPGALAHAAACFQTHPDMQMMTGHLRVIDQAGNLLRNSYSDAYDARAFAYGACIICQPSTFFRASLFKKTGGFNPHSKASWDAELFLDMLQSAGTYLLTDAFLSAFRVHDASITGMAKLRAGKREFQRMAFARIMRRPWRRSDVWFRYFYLARKYLLEPRSALQWLAHGSVAGRYKSGQAK